MSTLVNCPKCRVEIESDSYYCDQCGVELYICPQCHVFGKGKRCTQCGQPLVSAANQVVSPVHPSTSSVNSSASSVNSSASSVSPAPSEPEKTMRPGVSVPPLPVRLVCSAAGIRLGLGNGAVIGRRKGDYVSAFASQGYVSGTHARLQKSTSGQWEIVDLDSTNGTFVNGNRLSPNVPAVFSIGDIVRIANLDFKVE
ncbi:MAG: FHA domain-containing protein [Bacteroides sp.]|nr:FHA domain-containing protein [Bacteroides sp.]